MEKTNPDLLWKNISALPYFRGYLRAVEGRYYSDITLSSPVLDLGIGDGHFAATTFPGKVDFGIDPSLKSLREARDSKAAKLAICSMGDRLPFEGKYFQTVISNSVLEHIQNLKPVLHEVHRVLKEDGIFVICVPNDNFTKYLSVAGMFRTLHLYKLEKFYQRFFNKISRHYHPDDVATWRSNLESAGFEIMKSWNYFPPRSLKILEWGHFFGIPAWINKKIFGEWILIKKMWNLRPVYKWLKKQYSQDQTSPKGAYSFFVMRKG